MNRDPIMDFCELVSLSFNLLYTVLFKLEEYAFLGRLWFNSEGLDSRSVFFSLMRNTELFTVWYWGMAFLIRILSSKLLRAKELLAFLVSA